MVRVYLDTCAVIYLVEGAPEVRAPVLARLRRERPVLVVSDLTRRECRVGPMRTGDHATLALYDRFFRADGVELAPLSSDVFELATEIRARRGLRVPDALHVAAAVRSGCRAFWTNDLRLKAAEPYIPIDLTGP